LVQLHIIQLCQQRDQRAFGQLYHATIPYVYTLVSEYTKNNDIRKDLIQDIYAQVFLKLSTYNPDLGPFKPWLRMLTINQCLMFLRDQKKKYAFEDLDESATQSMQEEMSLHQLESSLVNNILQHMPEGYQQVFKLIVFQGYTHDEVGEALGIKTETSRSQYMRSRQWLKNRLHIENLV
jgi:RNA polymerase sigma factor (sigma-70 family)